MDFFPYYKQYPEQLSYFQKLMSVPRDGDWLDVVSFAEETANVSSDRALFVDIGGSIGHQSKRLRFKYPTLSGRVIVQYRDARTKRRVYGLRLFHAPTHPGYVDICIRFENDARELTYLQAPGSTTCALSSTIGTRRTRSRF